MLVYYCTFSLGFNRASKSDLEPLPLQSITDNGKNTNYSSNRHPYQLYHFTTGSAGVVLERSPLLALTDSSTKIKIEDRGHV